MILVLLIALWTPKGLEVGAAPARSMEECQAAAVHARKIMAEKNLSGVAACAVQGPSV